MADKAKQAQDTSWGDEILKRIGADTEEMRQTVNIARMFAPWANPRKEENRMSNIEIIGVILRCRDMGVNPFNPHEVSVWKNWQGIHIDYAYTIYIEWVNLFHGGMTKPISRRLKGDDLFDIGVSEDDFAVEARFSIIGDVRKNMSDIQSGIYERSDFDAIGVGVMTNSEIAKLGDNAAPTGRSLFFKVKKRAVIAAIRWAKGTPSPAEVSAIRARLGYDSMSVQDFAIDGLDKTDNPDQVLAMVSQHKALSDESREPILQDTMDALWGNMRKREKVPVSEPLRGHDEDSAGL